MIIDNSDSRAGDQARIAENLRSSLESLRDKNVEVFAYSTTLVDSKTTPYTQNPGAAGRYYGYNYTFMGGLSFSSLGYYARSIVSSLGLLTSYGVSANSALRSETYFIKNTPNGPERTLVTARPQIYAHDEVVEKYFLSPSVAPVDFKSSLGGINLSSGDSLDLQQQKINAVSDMIRDFGAGGSVTERPLCTLAMSLLNDGPNKIFEKGDKVAFMIITDEDQATSVDCPVGYSAKVETKEFVKASPRINYLLYYVQWDKSISSDGVVRVENIETPTQAKFDCLHDGSQCHQLLGGSEIKERECTAEEYNDSSITGHTLITGPVTYCSLRLVGGAAGGVGRTLLKNNQNYLLDTEDFEAQIDGEVQLINGKELATFLQEQQTVDHFWFQSGIQVDGSGTFTETDKELLTLSGVEEAGGLANLIRNKANTLLDTYAVTTISNKGSKNPTCPANVGISQTDFNAKESIEINKLSDISISICENDYKEVFDWFNNFVKNEADLEYDLSENVTELVGVKLAGSENFLTENMYTFESGILTFTDKSLLKFGNGEKFTVKFRAE